MNARLPFIKTCLDLLKIGEDARMPEDWQIPAFRSSFNKQLKKHNTTQIQEKAFKISKDGYITRKR